MKQWQLLIKDEKNTSPPSRGVWIETCGARLDHLQAGASPPSRGVWIETRLRERVLAGNRVAPLAGGVD